MNAEKAWVGCRASGSDYKPQMAGSALDLSPIALSRMT